MKQRGVNYFINEDVTFKAEYVHIRQENKRLLCSLEGEFLKNDEPFDPPMRYHMSDVGVTTQDKRAILTPIYYSLLFERKAEKK